jgi:pilus assembly protein CpaE
MSRVTKALVVLDERVDRALVETVMTSSSQLDVHDFVDLEGHRPGNDGSGDVVIVACADFGPEVGEYVSEAHRLHPARPVLVLCSHASNGYIGDAMAAGAEDILTIPPDSQLEDARTLSESMVFAVQKAVARRRGAPAVTGRKLGQMVCVLGLKGGAGKTLTASNLAVALAEGGASVAIVDLDLQFGDVGLALGLSPERTVYDLARSGGSLDTEKLLDFLAIHPSGVRALLAPARPDQAGVVVPEFLKDVYPLLREMHDFVIVDTPPSFTPEVIGAVDASTEVCMVSMLDSLALKNTKLGLETLELMDYQGAVRIVLNRADSSVGISPDDVMAIMGRAPDVLVPSDRNITRAVNQGEPIVTLQRKSEAARSFRGLAAEYLSEHRKTVKFDSTPARRRFRLRRGRR